MIFKVVIFMFNLTRSELGLVLRVIEREYFYELHSDKRLSEYAEGSAAQSESDQRCDALDRLHNKLELLHKNAIAKEEAENREAARLAYGDSLCSAMPLVVESAVRASRRSGGVANG